MLLSFARFSYERPNLEAFGREFQYLLSRFEQAGSASLQSEFITEINHLRNRFESMASLARIRYTLDTQDSFYAGEQDFFDEAEPLYKELVHHYYRALTGSQFKAELSVTGGPQLFSMAEMTLKTFAPDVIGDLQQENRLGSRYKKLIASAAIPFDGQERNLEQMVPYQQSADRSVRKNAYEARFEFFAAHQQEFDQIYDELVRLRTGMARKLGFQDFVALGYLRMNRSDYGADKVAFFRGQVERNVVPLASRLREEQRRRLGLDKLLYYDEKLFHPEGNAIPQGSPEEIVANGRVMYEELSLETGMFFKEMLDRGLMDLTSRKGKAAGGYCDYLAVFKAPFIFANFNGTSGDIDVLTHEAGHAFQVWLNRDNDIPEYYFPTMEAAEIPSMGMEFLTWPWMERFFGEQARKYRQDHLLEAFLFLPYGSLVDEFQHQVYAQPGLKPQERRSLWRETEKKFLPHRDYSGHPFLEAGGFWFQQGHIFEAPFYYIDYVLAQASVFQLWETAMHNRSEAWRQYLTFCRAGGRLPYSGIVAEAGLSSPFIEGTMEAIVRSVKAWLKEEKTGCSC